MPEENKTPEVQTATVSSAPALRDKRVSPEGVVPKQAQGYVVAGLALLILMAVMFSKNHAKPAPKEVASSSMAVSTDANQRKIQELEQDLSATQRQTQQAQQQNATTNTPSALTAPGTQAAGTAPAMQLPPSADPPRDPVADAERELAFKSRFVSNLVAADASTSRPSSPQADSADAVRPVGLPQQSSATQAATGNKRAPEVSVNSAHGQPYVVFEGTTIDTVLANRLDGEFAGPVKVMVTNPVYSRDRQHILIPEGTLVLGDVQKVRASARSALPSPSIACSCRTGTPSISTSSAASIRLAIPASKIRSTTTTSKSSASIALWVIAGAAEATTNSGYNESGSDAYRQGIASSLSQSSANVLDRFINVPPTITIREGHRIKVYITQDMLLPAYENHNVPGNI